VGVEGRGGGGSWDTQPGIPAIVRDDSYIYRYRYVRRYDTFSLPAAGLINKNLKRSNI
jgi:hypothetical protein